MRDTKNWALVCTTNDPESLTIVRLARALGIPLLESKQMHGATLAAEPRLFERVAEMGEIKHLAIVEIPGIEEEMRLGSLGVEVHIIDHHSYPGLDRMKLEASLTQFLHLFEITQEDCMRAGFDPDIIRGIALIDQGFLWELGESDLSEEKKRIARETYMDLKQEIDPKTEEAMRVAEIAWDGREERDGVVIVRTLPVPHIREAISFFLADAYPHNPPPNIVVEQGGRISVQETPYAEKLFLKYGGYLFGKKQCWGMMEKDGPPSVKEIVALLRG